MGSTLGPGRLHMLWGSWDYAPQLLSLHALDPVLCKKRSDHNEKPVHHN